MTTKANLNQQYQPQVIQQWLHKTTTSTGSQRLLLCGDLTVVQGAVICGWAAIAWILGLHTKDLHQLAVYGGIFCVQYLMVSVLGLIHDYIDRWNDLQTDKKSLNMAKRPLDTVVNVIGRLIIWGFLMGVAVFSGFHLRVIPMNCFINCVISGCAVGNYVLLLHVSGSMLSDCDVGVQNSPQLSTTTTTKPSHGMIARTSINIWNVVMKAVLIGCYGFHMLAHLWPLADTMLVSCLVALGVYMSRRSLDESWFSSTQVQHARNVAQNSRHLIWPVVVLFFCYCYDVIFTIFRLTRDYAMKFLLSVSTLSQFEEDETMDKSSESKAEEKEKLL